MVSSTLLRAGTAKCSGNLCRGEGAPGRAMAQNIPDHHHSTRSLPRVHLLRKLDRPLISMQLDKLAQPQHDEDPFPLEQNHWGWFQGKPGVNRYFRSGITNIENSPGQLHPSSELGFAICSPRRHTFPRPKIAIGNCAGANLSLGKT